MKYLLTAALVSYELIIGVVTNPWVVGVVSLLMAALRIEGVSGEIFQAAAHLWVGFLFGFGTVPPLELFGGYGFRRDKFAVAAAIALTVVEAICFFASGKPIVP